MLSLPLANIFVIRGIAIATILIILLVPVLVMTRLHATKVERTLTDIRHRQELIAAQRTCCQSV